MKTIIVALFLLLLGGAFYFNEERVLFCDASYILVRILNTGWFQIQEYRYGSAITQAFPYIGMKLGLPLKTIVVLYSISFNIFYLAVVIWLLRCGERSLAILMSFYFLLLVSDTYFWTNNEIHQAVAWMFLMFSGMFWMKRNGFHPMLQITVFSVLAFFTLFTHPLILMSFVFLWVFYISQASLWPFSTKWTIGFSAIVIAIIAIRFWVSLSFSKYGYDADKMQGALHFSSSALLHIFSSPMAKEFGRRLLTSYYLLPLLTAWGFIEAWRQKKFLPLAISAGAVLAYFIIMCLTFPEFITYYSESEWATLTLIATAPFVFYVVPRIKARYLSLLLAIVFIIRLGYILNSAPAFTKRKEWIEGNLQTMREENISKGMIHGNEQTKKILLQNNWSQPSESLIASALHGDRPTLTFVVDSPQNLVKRMPLQREMISDFETGYFEKFNPRYLQFDTSSQYRLLPSPVLANK